MSIRDKYAFVGVGLTRQGKIPEMNTDELAAQAISLAIQDAGIERSEVDGYLPAGYRWRTSWRCTFDNGRSTGWTLLGSTEYG